MTNMPMSPAGSGLFPQGSGVFPQGSFPDEGGVGSAALDTLEMRLRDLYLQLDPRSPQLSRDRQVLDQILGQLNSFRHTIPQIQLRLAQHQSLVMRR